MGEFIIAGLVILYIVVVIGCFISSFRSVHKFSKKKKKPNLTLIQGGKEEKRGPYGGL